MQKKLRNIAPLFSNNNLECQKYCLLMQPSKCMVLSLAHIQMMRACIQMIVCIWVCPCWSIFFSPLPHTHIVENVVPWADLYLQVTSHPVLVVFITVISHRWCLAIILRSWSFQMPNFLQNLFYRNKSWRDHETIEICSKINMHFQFTISCFKILHWRRLNLISSFWHF